jgi:gluconolactonase
LTFYNLISGLKKSAIVQKISVDEAEAVASKRHATGQVKVHVVNANPPVINPNGEL